jgi:hypothetical protein
MPALNSLEEDVMRLVILATMGLATVAATGNDPPSPWQDIEVDAQHTVQAYLSLDPAAVRALATSTHHYQIYGSGADEGRAVCGLVQPSIAAEGGDAFIVLYVLGGNSAPQRMGEPIFFSFNPAVLDHDASLAAYCNEALHRVAPTPQPASPILSTD